MKDEQESEEEFVDRQIAVLRERDRRYSRQAYLIIKDALDYVQDNWSAERKARNKRLAEPHVSPAEFIQGVLDYAVEQFGPMAHLVLGTNGIRSSEDVAEIVFNFFEVNVFRRHRNDTRQAFANGPDFEKELTLTIDLERSSPQSPFKLFWKKVA